MEHAMNECQSGFIAGDTSCRGRILLVDDESDIRKGVCLSLRNAGYEILEAESVEGAIQIINEGENRLVLDVVICDIRMPKTHGIEAIAYFRSYYPRVPLVVLTGFPDLEMAISLFHQGVVDYLVKPVGSKQLRTTVLRAMEQGELARL